MSAFWILLVISGIIIIVYPQIIAYMIGGLLLFFGLNILVANFLLKKTSKSWENYVKFWNYKIYKD